MGRILQLTPGYALSFRLVGASLQPSQRRALASEMGRLQREPLPDSENFEALLSPPAVGVAWARQVAASGLWLMYRFDDVHVSLHELTDRRPVGVD